MKPQLAALCAYAARRSPVAVLNCVRVTEGFGYATDSSSSMRYEIDGPKGLDVCIDAGLLAGALSGFPDDQQIKLTPGDGAFVHVQAGRRKLKLRTVPVDGMPEIVIANTEAVTLDALDLEPALKFCAEATLQKFTVKPELGNVLVDFTKEGVWLVGTDGFTAHVWKLDVENPGIEMRCLVPRALADRLASLGRFGGQVKLMRDRVVFAKDGIEFRGMLAQAVYPRWTVLLQNPEEFECRFNVGRDQLALAVDGAKQLGAQWVGLTVRQGELKVAADAGGDEYEQTLDIDYSGPETVFSLNPRYPLTALKHVDNEMTAIRISNRFRQFVIDDGDAMAIIAGRK